LGWLAFGNFAGKDGMKAFALILWRYHGIIDWNIPSGAAGRVMW
jgi:hypothetical protein